VVSTRIGRVEREVRTHERVVVPLSTTGNGIIEVVVRDDVLCHE
jgi:hypothetical protein